MKRLLLTFFILNYFTFTGISQVNENEIIRLYDEFSYSYSSGNFIEAEKLLLQLLDLSNDEYKKCSTYSNLGSLYIVLGRFDEALDYLSNAEQLNPESQNSKYLLAGVFINKAIIYRNRRSFTNAREYFEKGIRLYNEIIDLRGQYEKSLASAYYNFGLYYITTGEYQTALEFFSKSSKIKKRHNISNYLEMMNSARAFAGLKMNDTADKYFREGLSMIIKERGSNNFRLADFYFAYAQFLLSAGKFDEALEYNQSALKLFLQSFGEKHNLTSLAYKSIGDLYQSRLDYNTALDYYQKSLISVVRDFNDRDIYSNPEIDTSILDIRLLDNLKAKANALEMRGLKASDQNKIKDIEASLYTIELALDLTEIIKNNYPSEESKLYLADNEKETFMSAIRISSELCSITGNNEIQDKIFSIAQRAKASILRSQVQQNDILYSSSTPDSLRQKQRFLSSAIAAYNKHLQDEESKTYTDSSKIEFWKDELFRLNREKEKVEVSISELYPQYENLIKRMQPVTFDDLRKCLKKDETVIDYILSNKDREGRRQLYIFVIDRNEIQFRSVTLDSSFSTNALFIRNIADPLLETGRQGRFFNYTSAMHYMYKNLFSPIEPLLNGKRLIIIPDEEIAWLPFDAFLKDMPGDGAYDFEDLNFLINHYTFSYGYSASLISKSSGIKFSKPDVLSFSPVYGVDKSSPDSLGGAMKEIREIGAIFSGRSYTREAATKENFLKGMKDPSILHLAMHSMSDSINSLYSYLLFSPSGSTENSRLYNYEISLSRLNSPMIVLSSCNSGTGTLYSGEGLMSIARSFMLAGASSVVRTAWEVNDESGSAIITRFYYHLSKGKRKDDALRLAKLEFIKNSPPAYSDPYYWAAYEVLGDNNPVIAKKIKIVTIVTILLVCCLFIFYFRRFKISSERSL